MSASDRLVWIDLEMTGLDPETCVIVEIATIVTTSELEPIAEGPSLVIHQPAEVLEAMHPEVVALHTKSGLLEKIALSEVTHEQAESETLAFVQAHCTPRSSPLCGNSIWKDRQFLERYMPRLSAHLHYRNIDVSTIKELARRWYPKRYSAPIKQGNHRALGDIRESISELRQYRETFFVS